MALVDWITWKTDPKEIINPDEIITNLEDKYRDYHIYMNSVVKESISHEVQFGGLSQDSLFVAGESPAYDEANIILKQIEEIRFKMDQFKQQVLNDANYQKEIEKQQLITCIEEKIQEEENILNNTINFKNKIQNNAYISVSEVEDIIEITKKRINRLKERLDMAKQI